MDSKAADSLIVRVSKGDMAALEQLYGEYARAVYAYAMTIVKNSDAAEDIMQDVFVKIWRCAGDFKPQGLGKAWIMRIARNLSLNAVTRRRDDDSDEQLETMRAPDSPEDSVVGRVAVSEMLGSLTDEERQIVTLRMSSDMTLAEISKVLGQPLGTVKWKHAEAMKKLRRFADQM